MNQGPRYPTPAGVESAIAAAAKKAADANPSLNTSERIRLEYFNRFLSRVFSDGDASEWLLKGGTGMLARVPSSRATLDVDLYCRGFTLDEALADLRRLAALDLGDHFAFIYSRHRESVGGQAQPYVEGYAVTFEVLIGVTSRGAIKIDLATGAGITAEIEHLRSASVLDIPRLVSNEYRLYPLVDQIADKVCATADSYNGRPSSREKDLVDLVVIAVTQDVDGSALGVAIATETKRRKMVQIDKFVVPSSWGAPYAKLARRVPHCAGFESVDLAAQLVSQFINPALDGSAIGRKWMASTRMWT